MLQHTPNVSLISVVIASNRRSSGVSSRLQSLQVQVSKVQGSPSVGSALVVPRLGFWSAHSVPAAPCGWPLACAAAVVLCRRAAKAAVLASQFGGGNARRRGHSAPK